MTENPALYLKETRPYGAVSALAKIRERCAKVLREPSQHSYADLRAALEAIEREATLTLEQPEG